MLRRAEEVARWSGSVPLLVGGMAGAMAALGGGTWVPALWALPTALALAALRRLRPWLYLSLGDEALALLASRRLLAEVRTQAGADGLRLVAGAALLRLRRTAEAKATLATLDPARLAPGARPGFFLMAGTVAARVGDAPGTAAMALAAGAAAEAAGCPTAWVAAENLRAVGEILAGFPTEAAVRLGALDDGSLAGELAGVVRNNRAWAELRRGGDPDLALRWAREALETWPREPVFRGTLGAALVAAGGDPGVAGAHFAAALAVSDDVPPQERRVLFEYARRAADARGATDEARRLARRIDDIPGGDRLAVGALPARPGAPRGAEE